MNSDSEPTGSAAAPGTGSAGDELGLPPLPTLTPLPALPPMAPMPLPPFDDDNDRDGGGDGGRDVGGDGVPAGRATGARPSAGAVPAPRAPSPPPPPRGHPAATRGAEADGAGADGAVSNSADPANWSGRRGRHAASGDDATADRPDAEETKDAAADRAGPPAPRGSRRVLIVVGAGTGAALLAERLGRAGHRLAVRRVEPSPADLVARAERDLRGLDAVIVMPAASADPVGPDSESLAWATGWSRALESELLAASCVAQAAARHFVAQDRAGQIVLIVDRGDPDAPDPLRRVLTAALTTLGAELSGQLRRHRVSVSVVTFDRAAGEPSAEARVAPLVEAALLAAGSGTTVRVG